MTELVTAAVCAAFDAPTDAAVLAVRERVGRAGVRLTVRPRHRPHVSLAAVRIHPAQLTELLDVVRAVAAAAVPSAFVFDRLGTFTRAGALWLGPADAVDLRTLQRSVHVALAASPWPSAFGARTEPDGWVPHCSLVTRLDPATLAATKALLQQGFVAIDAGVTGLAVLLVGGTGDVGLVPLAERRPDHTPPAVTIASVTNPASSPTSSP